MGDMKSQFLNMEGLSAAVEGIRGEIKDVVENYDTLYDFPTTGKLNTIYIDKTNEIIYRWDDKDLKYYKIGFSPDSIQVIHGGNA